MCAIRQFALQLVSKLEYMNNEFTNLQTEINPLSVQNQSDKRGLSIDKKRNLAAERGEEGEREKNRPFRVRDFYRGGRWRPLDGKEQRRREVWAWRVGLASFREPHLALGRIHTETHMERM